MTSDRDRGKSQDQCLLCGEAIEDRKYVCSEKSCFCPKAVVGLGLKASIKQPVQQPPRPLPSARVHIDVGHCAQEVGWHNGKR